MARFGTTLFPRIRIGIGAGRYIYLPVLTTTQRNLLSASAGYQVYNSTTTQVESYNGSAWVAVGKLYGDTTFLPLAGGEMTGNITFSGAQTVDGVDVSAHAVDYGLHTKVIRKTATETVNNSTTLQNDDELLFAVAANEVWAFTLYLLSLSSTAADLKIGFTVPAGGKVDWEYLGYNPAGAVAIYIGDTNQQSVGILGDAIQVIYMIYGIVVNGATAGNLQFQWAQNTQEATNSQVLLNSCIVAHRIA